MALREGGECVGALLGVRAGVVGVDVGDHRFEPGIEDRCRGGRDLAVDSGLTGLVAVGADAEVASADGGVAAAGGAVGIDAFDGGVDHGAKPGHGHGFSFADCCGQCGIDGGEMRVVDVVGAGNDFVEAG